MCEGGGVWDAAHHDGSIGKLDDGADGEGGRAASGGVDGDDDVVGGATEVEGAVGHVDEDLGTRTFDERLDVAAREGLGGAVGADAHL